MMRLDKFLCECQIGTRTEVKKIIKAKAITINGEVALKPEQKVDEIHDTVCYRNTPVSYQKYHYYLFHKPAGCVSAVKDTTYKTVLDYFPKELQKGLSPVGRLDLDTEGLLILTDDGPLLHHLISPSHHVDKTYFAILDKEAEPSFIQKMQEGLDIGDEKKTLPAKLEILEDQKQIHLTIQEGRFHQVKRMFEALDRTVVYLKRIQMGSLTLGNLEKGTYRALTDDEIIALKEGERR